MFGTHSLLVQERAHLRTLTSRKSPNPSVPGGLRTFLRYVDILWDRTGPSLTQDDIAATSLHEPTLPAGREPLSAAHLPHSRVQAMTRTQLLRLKKTMHLMPTQASNLGHFCGSQEAECLQLGQVCTWRPTSGLALRTLAADHYKRL